MLKGIKVIDFSRIVAGPLSSQIMSSLGAEIIKVESINGDQLRNYGPPFKNDLSTYFLSVNIGKKSLALNFEKFPNESKNILYDLIKKADIFLQNFPFEKEKKFGLDYESLKNINNKLIYGSVTGYGEEGLSKKKSCFDLIIQAETGIMNLNQDKFGNPKKFPTAIVDQFTGLHLTNGILAALYNREKTGKGEKIAVNLFECGIGLLSNYNYGFLNTNEKPLLNVDKHSSIVPYGVFKCKNNESVLIGIGTDKLFKEFCEIFEKKKLLTLNNTNKKRVLNRIKLDKEIEKIFENFSAEEIEKKLDERNIPVSKVKKYNESLYSKHAQSINLIKTSKSNNKEYKYLKNCIDVKNNNFQNEFIISEKPGSHSEEILVNFLNYDSKKINFLKKSGIIQ